MDFFGEREVTWRDRKSTAELLPMCDTDRATNGDGRGRGGDGAGMTKKKTYRESLQVRGQGVDVARMGGDERGRGGRTGTGRDGRGQGRDGVGTRCWIVTSLENRVRIMLCGNCVRGFLASF